MRGSIRFTTFLLTVVLFASPLLAQYYPEPTTGSCVPPYTTCGYSSPISDYAGRYLDSSAVKDWVTGPYRSLRAKHVTVDRQRGRVYMRLGEHFVYYTISEFFTQLNSLSGVSRPDGTGEYYLPWSGAIYAELGGSGWNTIVLDGQDRLFDYAFDDRGYIYLAYSVFGWGIVQNSTFTTVSQPDGINTSVIPTTIEVFKANGRYYVLASGDGTEIWDVTDPLAAVKVRTLPDRVISTATVPGGTSDVVALVSNFTLKLYSASSLITGGSPFHEDGGTSSTRYKDVQTDGLNFFGLATPSVGKGFTLRAMARQAENQYQTRTLRSSSEHGPTGIRFSEGHITLFGRDTAPEVSGNKTNVWLYRVEPDLTLTERPLTSFFREFYNDGSLKSGIRDVVFTEYNGNEYLVLQLHGVGEVYELESTDRVSVSSLGTGGTQNPNSPTSGTGPFYGDPLRFSSSYKLGQINVNWDFGNPEGVGTNQQTTISGTTVTHQYSGLTTTAAIQAPKTVTVRDISNANNSDSMAVSLQVPTARFRIEGTSHIFPDTSINQVGGLVAGERFIDASDGTIQSHYGEWTFDGATKTGTPSEAQSVGTCGNHTVTYTARYVPYTGSGASITPALGTTKHFTRSVGPISYQTKAFIPVIKAVSSGSTIVFENRTRHSASTFNGGAQWTVTWSLVDSQGTTLRTETDISSIGTVDTFNVAKSEVQAGYVVTMVLAVQGADVADTSCATPSELTQQATFELVTPDPVINRTGCLEARGNCELTVASSSGAEESDWSIVWYLDGNPTGVVGPSYKPNFQSSGTYQVRASATNDIGTTDATITLTVAPASCTGYATAISISYRGLNSNCLETNCTNSSEPIELSVTSFGYSFQSCDTFSWNIAGTQKSGRTVQHTFSGNGPHNVSVTVSNQNGSTTANRSISFGSVQPPPPDCTAPQQGRIFAEISGAQSGCTSTNPNCAAGEVIQFSGVGFGYTFQTCDTFRWTFGDGSVSNQRNPTHVYATKGTYTATFTVQNTAGSASDSVVITIGDAVDPNCPDAPVVVDLEYNGPTSGCSVLDGSPDCLVGEAIKFKPVSWPPNRAWQTCDEFLWNFGDGSTSDQREPTHSYGTESDGKEVTVSLTVSNKNGSQTVSRTFLVGTPLTKPTSVDYTFSPSRAKPGEPVTFSASTQGGDPASKFEWDFGDGSPKAVGQTVSHVFATEGSFKVGVAASNSGGFAYTEKFISVADSLTYLLPVVTHFGGANDSTWRTDLHVFQPEFSVSGAIEIELDFKGMKKTMFFDSSTEIFEDFLGEITSADDAGPIFLSTPVPIDMWTRTYNVSSTGVGTFGQLIPAVLLGDSNQAIANETYWNIGGLRNDNRFRTNLGFVNPTEQRADVTVHIFEEEFGLEVGKFDVSIDPHQLRQQPLSAWFPTLPADQGFSLRIQSRNGVDVVSYASVIDNISNDPVFVGAIPDSVAALPEARTLIVPGVGHIGTWRSDLTIFNPDSQAVALNLEFFADNGTLLGQAPNVVLPSKGALTVEDLLRSTLMNVEEEALGTLRVTTTSPNEMYPIIFDRTYNDQQALGTYGQGIPAFPATASNVKFGSPAFIPGVRNDSSYRTNVGLVALGDQAAEVTVQLLHPNTGQPTHANTILLEPNQSKIIPRAISQFLQASSASGTLKIVVQSGGPVWAYGSVIDNLTDDPEYIPAAPSAPGSPAAILDDPEEAEIWDGADRFE